MLVEKTSDEVSDVKLGRSHEHYLCHTFHLSLSSQWRAYEHTTDVPDVALEKQYDIILIDVGLMCLSHTFQEIRM